MNHQEYHHQLQVTFLLAQSEYDNFKMGNFNQNLAATTSSPMDMWSLVPQSVYDITSDEWAQFFQTFTQQQNNN